MEYIKVKVVFYDTLCGFGGSHTLIIRMCKWLSMNNIDVEIISVDKPNEEYITILKEMNVSIRCVQGFNLKMLKTVLQKLLKDDKDLFVINFTIDKWLDIEVLKKIHNYQISNIIYDIHPETFYKGLGVNNKVIKKIVKDNVRNLLLKIYNNNSVIVMDEINIESTYKYLGLLQKDYNPTIFRLPMICDSFSNCDKVIKTGYAGNIIMTASRADFPFKGYIIGLIDDFSKLKSDYKDLKLWIVSDGPCINLLLEKIDSLSNEIKKDIEVYSWMPYSELKLKMEKCKVYIGMGTTILDACLKYKPAIPTAFNTFQNKTNGFFSDNPLKLSVNNEDSKESLSLINSLLKLNFNQYRELCFLSYNAVKNNYNIETVMKELLSLKVKVNNAILTNKECLYHILHVIINKFRYGRSLKHMS